MIRDIVKQLVTIIISIAVIAGVVMGGIKLWQKLTYKEPVDEQAVPVSVIEIDMPDTTEEEPTEKEAPASISKTAFVIADQEIEVFSEVSGVIKQLNIMEGQQVTAGQVVASLGDSTQLKTAVSSYNAAIASIQNAEKQIKLARLSTNVSVSMLKNQVISAQNSIRQASFQLEAGQDVRSGQQYIQDLQKENQQLQEKLNIDSSETASTDSSLRSAASEQDKYSQYIQKQIDANTVSIDKTQQDVTDIQGLQQDSQYTSQIRESKNQIDQLLKQMESTQIQGQSQVIQLESQIIQLRQQLESAQINLAAGRITSPISGIVTSMTVRTGDRVGPQAAMFTVTNMESTVFQASLTPAELITVHNSEPTIEILGEEVPAEIVYIGATASNQTKTIPVKVVPKQSINAPVVPNTFARVKFTEKQDADDQDTPTSNIQYPVVPVRIMKFNGGYNVPVAENGVLVYKKVTLGGKIKNGLAPIKTGLKDGDLVIIDRLNLEEGEQVQPI